MARGRKIDSASECSSPWLITTSATLSTPSTLTSRSTRRRFPEPDSWIGPSTTLLCSASSRQIAPTPGTTARVARSRMASRADFSQRSASSTVARRAAAIAELRASGIQLLRAIARGVHLSSRASASTAAASARSVTASTSSVRALRDKSPRPAARRRGSRSTPANGRVRRRQEGPVAWPPVRGRGASRSPASRPAIAPRSAVFRPSRLASLALKSVDFVPRRRGPTERRAPADSTGHASSPACAWWSSAASSKAAVRDAASASVPLTESARSAASRATCAASVTRSRSGPRRLASPRNTSTSDVPALNDAPVRETLDPIKIPLARGERLRGVHRRARRRPIRDRGQVSGPLPSPGP